MREPDWQSEDGSIRLYRGDCLEVMPELTETVDCICTDLPYGTTACKWDSVIPFAPLWEAYKRAIKPKGAIVLFGSQPFTSTLMMSNPKWFKYELIWDKGRGFEPQLANIRPMKSHENILVFCAGRAPYNPQKEPCEPYTMRRKSLNRDGGQKLFNSAPQTKTYTEKCPVTVLRAGFERGLHPTQKPAALLEYLVRTYTNPGETVLDNTFGSGTTAVACINTGRKFIGIERDEHYFDVAVKRCEDALAARQGSLFPNDEAPVAV